VAVDGLITLNWLLFKLFCLFLKKIFTC
jgi:hypothetical protein